LLNFYSELFCVYQSTAEAFVVCQGFDPPADFESKNFMSLVNACYDAPLKSPVVPFVICGDLNGFDADQSYPLQRDGTNYTPLDVVQPPIQPAYKEYLERKRKGEFNPTQ
jgi:tRNA (cytidine32/guanosine34-2'-O)-methyltransferase